jgi:hypothetical protein
MKTVVQHRRGHDHGSQASAVTFIVTSQPPAARRREYRTWYSESQPLASGMRFTDGEGEVQLLGEDALRTKARALIDQGKLPLRSPERMWGGPGAGTLCSVCGMPITEVDKELEVQVQHDSVKPGLDRFHFHI